LSDNNIAKVFYIKEYAVIDKEKRTKTCVALRLWAPYLRRKENDSMAKKTLKPEQYIAIEWLAQPKQGGKKLDEIAELCDVTVRTLYDWRKDDTFQRELKAEMIRRSQSQLPQLIESLAEIAIRDGNAAMAKLALQINGMLVDKHEIETKDKSEGIDYDALDSELDSFEERLGEGDRK
jgi:hypothetical protein